MHVSVPGTLYNIVNSCGKSYPHPVLIIAYFPDPGPDMDLCLFHLNCVMEFFHSGPAFGLKNRSPTTCMTSKFCKR